MAVFNLDRRFNDLIRVIERTQSLTSGKKKYFIDYINGVKQGTRNNDFCDDELLERVMLEIINYKGYGTPNNHNSISYFEKLITRAKIVFPFGSNTENYELLKDLFVNCISTDTELFNDGLFAMFNNKRDYLDIINLIRSNEKLLKNASKITEYGAMVATYCQTQDVLKREIISFASNVLRTDNIDNLIKLHIMEAQKRMGIYDVDEQKISLAAAEFEKARSLIKKIEELETVVNNYCDRIRLLTDEGKRDLTDARKELIDGLKQYEISIQDAINKRIDSTLTDAESDLKIKSDKIFSKVLSDAQAKINEIKIIAGGLSSSTTDELLKIQEATEESVRVLKEYVENEPKLQKLLSGSQNSKELKELLTVLQINKGSIMNPATKEEKDPKEESPELVAKTSVIATPGIYVPGNDRLVVPINNSVILPEGAVSNSVLPAFDERIPFEVRMKTIEDKIKEMKKNGEIFHSKTEEIIKCIMEGDWVYLWGPSGCGKSYTVKQIAKLLGIDLVQNGKITDKYSIMAYNDPHGRFRATQAFIALLYGKLLSFDEFDNGNPDTQVVLNELYSGLKDTLENPDEKKYVTFGEDMSVPIHPNFRMISAGNTAGAGEDILNSARGKIDESVQQRMTPKELTYDNQVEKIILSDYDGWYDLFVKFRKVCDDYARSQGMKYAQGILTTRDASDIAKYARHNSKSLDQVLREKFIQVKNDNYLNYIITNIKNSYNREGHNIDNISDVKEKKLSDYSAVELGKKLVYTASKSIQNGNRRG